MDQTTHSLLNQHQMMDHSHRPIQPRSHCAQIIGTAKIGPLANIICARLLCWLPVHGKNLVRVPISAVLCASTLSARE